MLEDEELKVGESELQRDLKKPEPFSNADAINDFFDGRLLRIYDQNQGNAYLFLQIVILQGFYFNKLVQVWFTAADTSKLWAGSPCFY